MQRGEDTRFIQAIKRPYLRMLNWALGQDKTTILAATALFIGTILLVPFLGDFLYPGNAGRLHRAGYQSCVPNISLEESIKMENDAMRLIMEKVPGVKSAVSGVGRGESPG